METNRRSLALAAVLAAAGSAAPLAAQPADPSVNVLAPRAAIMPPLPLTPPGVWPAAGAVQSAGFRPFAPVAATQPQPMPTGEPLPQGQSAWLTAPPTAMTTAAPNPQPPAMSPTPAQQPTTYATPYPAQTAPVTAPAWRWYGYGAAAPAEVPQPANSGATLPMPTPVQQSAPSGSAVPAAPMGYDSGTTAPDWRQPGTVPAFAAPQDLTPPPIPAGNYAAPVSYNQPQWRPATERTVFAPTNPMQTGPDPWIAPARQAVVARAAAPSAAEWRGRSAMLAPPQVASGPIQQAVAWPTGPATRPVSYTVPAPPPAPPPVSVSGVRANIERLCAGRGRDLELTSRGPTSLLVRLKVRQATDAEYLAHAIAQLPELTAYQVLFEMQVVR